MIKHQLYPIQSRWLSVQIPQANEWVCEQNMVKTSLNKKIFSYLRQ